MEARIGPEEDKIVKRPKSRLFLIVEDEEETEQKDEDEKKETDK